MASSPAWRMTWRQTPACNPLGLGVPVPSRSALALTLLQPAQSPQRRPFCCRSRPPPSWYSATHPQPSLARPGLVPSLPALCRRFRSTDTVQPKETKPDPREDTPLKAESEEDGRPKVGDYMDSAPPKYTSSASTNARLNLLFAAATAVAGGGALLLFSWLKPLVSEPEAQATAEPFAPTVEDMDNRHPNALLRFWNALVNTLNDFVIEPIGTVKRFFVLFFLFFPVLVVMPMLLVGKKGETKQITRRAANGDSYVEIDQQDRWGAIWWYDFLVKQMERAGPTFIKLAQWAGSRQDLFPNSLCDRLGKLHSNGKPHSLKYTKRVIARVFGRKFEDIFEEFGEEPLGIGAVAQVYKGKLKADAMPPGRASKRKRRATVTSSSPASPASPASASSSSAASDAAADTVPETSVAIKVLHPKVHRTIARDIRIMTFFAKLINLLPGAEWLSFPEEVQVFSEMMFSQLDLRNEASNLLRFDENFSQRAEAISFPRPLAKFSTKELLIEQYEDALPLKHFLKNGGAGFDHRIATLGLDTFLYMLLLDNFTHADLHPGNIMIKFYHPSRGSQIHSWLARMLAPFDSDYRVGGPKGPPTADEQAEQDVVTKLKSLKDDSDAWNKELDRLESLGYQPELVLLDAGLTVELTPTNRRNFLDLFSAVAQFNGELAGHLMVERCRTPDLVLDKEGFAMKMQRLVLSVKSKTFSLAQIKISDVLTEVLMAVRDHHVKMEADFVNTVISILLLEGIGRRLDPSMDLFKSSLPILRSLGRQIGRQEASRGIHVPDRGQMKDLSPMLKVWIWLEAKSWLDSLAGVDVQLATYDFA